MIPRLAIQKLSPALSRQAAVALIGPRQVGKTTMAHELAANPIVCSICESGLRLRSDRAEKSDLEIGFH